MNAAREGPSPVHASRAIFRSPSPRLKRIASLRSAMMPPLARAPRGSRREINDCPSVHSLIRGLLRVSLSVVLLLLPVHGVAQLAVDQVPPRRTVPIRDQVEIEMESARLRFGPFHVTPLIRVENAGYDANVFHVSNGQEKTGDWTATVGAGGRALLPMGSKFYLRLVAVPQYIWYNTLTGLNSWGGDFSAGFPRPRESPFVRGEWGCQQELGRHQFRNASQRHRNDQIRPGQFRG